MSAGKNLLKQVQPGVADILQQTVNFSILQVLLYEVIQSWQNQFWILKRRMLRLLRYFHQKNIMKQILTIKLNVFLLISH